MRVGFHHMNPTADARERTLQRVSGKKRRPAAPKRKPPERVS